MATMLYTEKLRFKKLNNFAKVIMEFASDPDLSENKALLQHSFMHAGIH